ncbi:MAG: PEGA domain-containing protein [Myxococcales bacterium]|nr:PEGA domain-containing protein [Myxococcales bacterium]
MPSPFLLILAIIATVTLAAPLHAVAQGPGKPGSSDRAVDVLRVDQCGDDNQGETAAERKKKASQLYDQGLVLYEEGDYEGAIEAFVESYCAKPHPASFYNIAQSYERLLRFELSIAYFGRYVSESNPEAPTTTKARLRADVLRILPAQIRVATVPAGASIAIHDTTGLRARGKANQDAPLEVVQGEYTMHVSMPGYEDAIRSITTKPGQPYSYYLRLDEQTGTLNVSATPSNARLLLNDRLVDEGSYSEKLPVGRYEITAEAPGREAETKVVTIKSGESSQVSLELAPPTKSGRNTLLYASTIGLGLTGASAMSSIFGQDSATTVAGVLASSAVGFGGAYYGIPKSTTQGDAWLMIEVSLIGVVEGALVGSFFACSVENVGEFQERECSDKEQTAVTAAALSGGLLGMAGSAMMHKRLKLDTGDAAVLGSAALWGVTSSALLYAVFDDDLRIRDPILFSGLNFGLVAGAGILATSDLSLERIAIIDLGGLGGVLSGALLAGAFQSGDEQLQHFSILGMVAGLVGATFLTRDMDDIGAPTKRTPTTSGNITPLLTPIVSGTTDAGGNLVPNLGLSIRI